MLQRPRRLAERIETTDGLFAGHEPRNKKAPALG
jgi:hypothetical protein